MRKTNKQQQQKKLGKAAPAIGSILQDLHKTHREGERELDKGGADGGEEKKKQKQEDRINVGRVCTAAGKPECCFFFPSLSLQLCPSLSLFLSTFLL